jgi:hypothetical protein
MLRLSILYSGPRSYEDMTWDDMAIVTKNTRAPTAAQWRVLEELQQFGAAVCEFREHDWSWKVNGRAVTGPLYGLARKGWVEIETPAPGAKAVLKTA